MKLHLALASVPVLLALACSSPSSPTDTTTSSTTTSTSTSTGTTSGGSTGSLPALYAKFQSAVTVSISGSTVTLVSNTTPDHKSPYWGTSSANYEAPHSGMQVNPFLIQTQNLTFRIPTSPAAASSTSDTPLGPIGISVNGVVFYNQYAAGRQPLTTEIVSFDRYNGHPNPNNQYHYHFEPVAITSASRWERRPNSASWAPRSDAISARRASAGTVIARPGLLANAWAG